MIHRTRVPLLLAGIAGALALTACGGGDGAGTGGDATSDPATGGASSTVSVTAGDLFFEPTTVSATAGTVTIELDNEGAVLHNVVIEETGEKVAEADGGASDTGTIDLEPGTYTFFCDVPGHREGGMEGTLEVS